MKKIALIGDSIAHSLSPKLFEAAYNHDIASNLVEEFSYNLLDYSSLNAAMTIFLNEDYYGANITSPYKKEIFSYCTELDITAKQTGAANLILKQENGIKAYNTDCEGVYGPLKTRNLKPCEVIVAGAGGAARAAIYILKKSGYTVTIVNRTPGNAAKLAQEYNVKWATIESLPQLLKTNKLLVYTIGTTIDALKNEILNDIIILEANYKSPALKNKYCKEYIPGTEWLIYQAVPSFRLFTRTEPNIYAMLKVTNSY